MQHLAAYYSSVDQGGVLSPIAGIQDQSLYVDGDDIRVPVDLPFLAGTCMSTGAATVTSAQIRTPSLRPLFYPDVNPINTTVVPGNPPAASFNPGNPIALVGLENMNFYTNTDNAGVADIYGLTWLQDGPVAPVTGNIRTIRATAAAALSAGAWVNANITFDQVLPVGDYQIVGMRVLGTGLVAARAVIQGYGWRPGVLGRDGQSDVDDHMMRMGMPGVMGTFNNNVPPTVDFLGDTGTSQAVYFDLIKVS